MKDSLYNLDPEFRVIINDCMELLRKKNDLDAEDIHLILSLINGAFVAGSMQGADKMSGIIKRGIEDMIIPKDNVKK